MILEYERLEVTDLIPSKSEAPDGPDSWSKA